VYAVVGCSDCGALWVVEGRPERTRCPRCGASKAHAKRRKFVSTDDREHAARVRASMLAERAGLDEAFADLDATDERAAAAVVSDEEYLESAGVDPDAVAAAGERSSAGGSLSRRERVREALRELDGPTADDVAAYCEAHGVDAAYAREALDRLVRRGDATENGGVYRPL